MQVHSRVKICGLIMIKAFFLSIRKMLFSVCRCWKALDAEANTIDDCVHIYIAIRKHMICSPQQISQNIL